MSSGYGPAGDSQEMITLIRTAVERVSGSSTPLTFAALLSTRSRCECPGDRAQIATLTRRPQDRGNRTAIHEKEDDPDTSDR
jgi:hypothetical protein